MARAQGCGRVVVRLVAALVCAGATLAVLPGVALATLWVSSSGTDTGYCSQANPCATISRAVSLAIPNDTIYVSGGTFTDHVTIPADVTGLVLQGAGMHSTVVSGGYDNSGSVFTIQYGTNVTINDMSITGGQASDGGGIDAGQPPDAGTSGPGGDLTLQRDEIFGNSATGAGSGGFGAGGRGLGGGVFAFGDVITISDSAIVDNQASHEGGGIWAFGSAVRVQRDLVYANSVAALPGQVAQGGGVWLEDGVVAESTLTGNRVADSSGNIVGAGGGLYALHLVGLVSSTVVGNSAAAGTGAEGGAVFVSGTILDGRCDQSVGDFGHNLVQDPSCVGQDPDYPGTIITQDFKLGPLADNGGPTETMAITSSSPAYDANPASNSQANCGGTDQRGVSDLQRGATSCDIGAYQVSAPTTYVANSSGGSVTAYATDATGDAAPVLRLNGANTGLNHPTGVVTDVNGDVFVANPGNNSVTEYAPEVTGNVAPIATLAGSHTGLSRPQDLALDGSGRLLVTNLSGSVTEYAPVARGNAAPVARITGSMTRLKQPHGIVIDPNGDIRVTNANGTVDTYAPNATGNVAPVSQLTGGALTNPQGLNFDASGQMVVADAGAGRVDTFAGSAGANAQPTRVLTGAPALQAPTGLDLDEPGDIFIADTTANRVLEFAPGSQNGASAMTDIDGPDTGLSRPAFLSELPPTPAPHLRVSTSRRQARKRILANGIVLALKASGRLAFRGAPVLISALARVGHVTVAQAKAAPLRPGKAVLRLIQTPRAARVLPRHGTKTIVVTVTVRDGSGRQTHRITIKCRS